MLYQKFFTSVEIGFPDRTSSLPVSTHGIDGLIIPAFSGYYTIHACLTNSCPSFNTKETRENLELTPFNEEMSLNCETSN